MALISRFTRTAFWLAILLLITPALPADRSVIEQAERIDRLHSLLVLQRGEPVIELVRAGPGLDQPANIKSVSKTVLSALAGIAIDRGVLTSPDQRLVELLGDRVPDDGIAPWVAEITLGHALSMQTGLRSTSGRYYGRWVQSADWVAHVLTRPMVDRPGGRMIYSTGSTHLVSAALTAASGKNTLALAREWLGQPMNVRIPPWLRDPQGVYFGGNDMHLSPRALARFGELYRRGGRLDGRRILSADWIRKSWQPNGRSPWTGDDYGYGWFITEIADRATYYGRGFGGQGLFVVPESALTIVMTADPNPPSPGGRHFRHLRELVALIIEEFKP
ncbi:serine hydrolase domain-containing protein [Wenzhouxiangella limi]|nr:serine hydrolase [Wenzhouxiangella limi]